MNDFRFYHPVRIHFGKDAMEHLPEELAARTDMSCWAYKEMTREDGKAILRMAL